MMKLELLVTQKAMRAMHMEDTVIKIELNRKSSRVSRNDNNVLPFSTGKRHRKRAKMVEN